jgi:TRAP-type mannitol/chloroaromatic compound transport system permease large subunit
VIPLFILMGNFATPRAWARDLYRAAYAWIGHRKRRARRRDHPGLRGLRGALRLLGRLRRHHGQGRLPEMRRYRYDPGLATGGSPPAARSASSSRRPRCWSSMRLLTEQSIGRLFLAGFLPGLLLTLLFILTILIVCAPAPRRPPGERAALRERFAVLADRRVCSVVGITIGGIYAGIFTVTEAAAVGAFLTMVHALWTRA